MARPTFRSLLPSLRPTLALACVSLVAAGCSTPSSSKVTAQNEQMSTLASGGPLAAISAATSSLVDPITDTIVSILPYENEASPESQRRKMEEYAGPSRFRQEGLAAGRDEMTRHREEFREHKGSFASPTFEQSRARLRSGDTRPQSGPVLGSAIATTLHDPDVARSLLSGLGTSTGVPVVMSNPILAQLLPAFGN